MAMAWEALDRLGDGCRAPEVACCPYGICYVFSLTGYD